MCALGSRHPKKCLSDWEAPGLEENWTVKCSKFPSGPLHCQGMSVRNFCTSGNIFLGGSHSTCQSPLSATSSPLAFPHAVPGALSLLGFPPTPKTSLKGCLPVGLPLLLQLLPPEHQLAAIISFGLWWFEGVSASPQTESSKK